MWRVQSRGENRSHLAGGRDEIVNQGAEKIENDRSNRHASTRLPENSVTVLISGSIINRVRLYFWNPQGFADHSAAVDEKNQRERMPVNARNVKHAER